MTLTFIASSDYDTAGKQFIARITGRDKKFTFAREFCGRRSGKRNDYTEAIVDDPGLYQIRSTTRKGNADEFRIVWVDGETFTSTIIDESDAMTIAKSGDDDYTTLGRRAQIARHSYLIARAEQRDKNETVSVTTTIGTLAPGSHVRRDVIAARHAEIVRLTAASEQETDAAKTKRGIDLSL